METGIRFLAPNRRETSTSAWYQRGVLQVALVSTALLTGTSASAEETSFMEEIVVSAKRDGVSVMDLPTAITAISSDKVEEFNISDGRDLQFRVPGLVATEEIMIPKVHIRGIGQEALTFAQEQGVAIHTDGVYKGRTMSSFSQQLDLAAVEVLRGPQGTLYGRNATAGAINYASNQPHEDRELRLTALAGNFDQVQIKAVGNVPLSEQVYARLAFGYQSRDGYVENLAGGSNIEDNEVTAGRFSLLFQPTDSVDVLLAVDAQSQDSNGASFHHLDTPFGLNFFGAIEGVNYAVDNDEWESFQNVDGAQPSYTERDDVGVTLTVNWEISPELSFRSLTAYRDFEHRQGTDTDGSTIPFLSANEVHDTADQFSQEFNLNITRPNLDAVLGLFAYFENATSDNQFEFYQGIVNPAAPGGATPPLFSIYNADLDTTSYAAFADFRVHFPDMEWMRLLAGVRYTSDDKETDLVTGTRLFFGGGFGAEPSALFDSCGNPFFPVVQLAKADGSDGWNEVTGHLGLEFDLGEAATGYVKASRGYKAGGFNDFPSSPLTCGASFEPEEVLTYEAGLKFTALDDTLSAALAVFSTDYDDLQVQRVESVVAQTVNAAKASITGAEIEFVWSFASGFSIDGFVSLLDAEYDDFDFVYPLDPTQTVTSLKGVQMPRAPEYSGLLGLEYTQAVSDSGAEITGRVEMYYTDDIVLTPGASEFSNGIAVQDGYELLNAYLTYRNPSNKNLTIRLFGKNLSDEFYYGSVLPVPPTGSHIGFAAPPRTFGVEVTIDM